MFRKLGGAALALTVGLVLVIAGVVFASGGSSPANICVPTKEGKTVVTPKKGVCKTGYTLTEVGDENPTESGTAALFGDGSDGSQTISANTTLTRDMYYENLTVAAGVTLNPGGYRLFVAGTLTLDEGAQIARDGSKGQDPARVEVGLAAGTLGGSGAGAGENGEASSTTDSLGGSGGDEPAFSIHGGHATPPGATVGGAGVFRSVPSAISGRDLAGEQIQGGAGGAGTEITGGGAGGGVVVVVARTVTLNGSSAVIAANGGSARTGEAAGGGGGVVVVVSSSAQPSGLTLSAGLSPGQEEHHGEDGHPGFTDWLAA
jgi:hypothetical protein